MKQPLQLFMVLVISICWFQSCQFFDSEKTELSEVPIMPATKNGWWIKVDTAATECPQITFNIGTDEEHSKFWMGWNEKDTFEFDTPVEYRHSTEQLYIKAVANPPGKAEFCVMYDAIGVKRFSFDNQQALVMKHTDRDDLCY